MFVATAKNAVQDSVVIIGTLFVHMAPTIVLFDSGSTHTFIGKIFVDRIGMFVGNLGYDLVVDSCWSHSHN